MSDNERERSRDRDRKRERPTRFSDTGRDRSLDGGKDQGGLKSSVCRVYVSNVPYEYRWQDLKDLFRSQVGDVAFVELFVDEAEKPRGCGIVEFSDAESVKKCLEVMHRFEIKGRKLVIKEDFGNKRDKYGNLVGTSASKRARERDGGGRDRFDDRRGGGGSHPFKRAKQEQGDSKWGSMYGLSPQFLDSLGINGPLINRIFIANLDYKVDKKKLKEVFRLAGKVQNVDLSCDKDGKSRGFAVLEYDHPVEAVQAISMFHNHFLYDRAMTVRMDREGDRPITKLPEGLKNIGMGLGSNGEPLKDITHNLPSIEQNSNQGVSTFGSTPSIQLGLGNSLSALTNASALGGLNANAAVLQAANLAGVGGLSSNLLASSLGSGDLGLSNSRLINQSLSALAASRNLGSSSNFSRELGSNQGGSRYQDNKNFLNGADGRDDAYGKVYSTVNNGGQMGRSSGGGMGPGKSGGYSNKILLNNVPPSATYKMLNDKCNEFGNVQNIEDKGNNGILVTYGTEWEAERAIKNLDRARIDGRIIDVRFFY